MCSSKGQPKIDRHPEGSPATVPDVVAARYSGRGAADCLAYGVACGAESTQHLGAGLIDPERVMRLLAETDVQRQRSPAEIS